MGAPKYVVMQEEEGRQEMERTWKPIAAGILCIVAGIIVLIPVMVFGRWSPIIGGIGLIVFAPLIPLILFGILPIVGGIYALRRRRWGLALAGSICCPLVGFVILGFYFLFGFIGSIAVWPRTPEFGDTIPTLIGFIVAFVIFGILPIVFVILGKREFKANALVSALYREESADACYKRGDAYDETGKYDKAITSYSKAIELDPNHALSYYNRGCAYGEIGAYDKAIADYNKAIELNPNDALAYYNRGLACSKRGEVPKAVSDLEKCIELSTDPELTKDAQQALLETKNSP